MFQIIIGVYSIISVVVFVLLIVAKNSGNVKIDYLPEVYPALNLLGEMGWFALVALLWPLFLVGAKIRKS